MGRSHSPATMTGTTFRVCQVFENRRKISTKMHFVCQKFYPQKSAAFTPINGKNLGKTEVFEGDIFFIATLWLPLTDSN